MKLKRANGSGTVYKLSGRRRRPYTAVVTVDCKCIGDNYIQKRKSIGYYKTKAEAITALYVYNNSMSEAASTDTMHITSVKASHTDALYESAIHQLSIGESTESPTFSDIYEAWSKVHFKSISPTTIRTWRAAYMHLSELHDMTFADIRPRHIETCIGHTNAHSSTKLRMKSLCNLLYKYAIKNEIATINYAELCDRIKPDPPKIIRKPFTEDEIRMLWQHFDIPNVDLILIAIYMGWRPQELTRLKLSDVKLDTGTYSGYIIGGIKTAAGINRLVPIHSDIFDLVYRRYVISKKRCSEYLISKRDGTPITYSGYRYIFNVIMNRLKITHLPHDTRHTFVTMSKDCGLDEYILKIIVGHTISDVTERVYTHRRVSQLTAEITKLPSLHPPA